MPEVTNKAAVSGEYKLVPMQQLKKWHRDLDACQKVMWIRGGFDPAYCMDAQDCLKEMEGVLAAPVPPAVGEVEILAVVDETDGVFPETLVTHRDAIDAAPVGTELIDRIHVTRLQAENAALQQRLNDADQRIDDLEQDKARLDSIEANYWDVRHHSTPIADTGDHSTSIEIVGHWMDKPHERVIGENYNENLRAAIDQAMKADACPPARPEYPEIDAALNDDNWQMNPCKQGHRDVGACQGKAFCHTCAETITAATTEEAFEQWNASHPTVPQ